MMLSAPTTMALAQDATGAVRETWRFLEMPAPWVVVLILLPAAFAIAALAYWREPLRPQMRWALISLRFLSLLLLLFVLFRPVFVRQQQLVLRWRADRLWWFAHGFAVPGWRLEHHHPRREFQGRMVALRKPRRVRRTVRQ